MLIEIGFIQNKIIPVLETYIDIQPTAPPTSPSRGCEKISEDLFKKTEGVAIAKAPEVHDLSLWEWIRF